MKAAALTSLLIIAGIAAHCKSLPRPPHRTERRQEIVGHGSRDETSSEDRGNIMSFLTTVEQPRTDASGKLRPQLARNRASGKRADNKSDTGVVEEFLEGTSPAISEKEMKDELLAPSPLKEKESKKMKKQTLRKTNRRACFWKYCN